MNRTLSPLAKRRRFMTDIIEAVVFVGIVVAMYVFTGLCLRWAGVA